MSADFSRPNEVVLRAFYLSSNGDRWSLGRDKAEGRVRVIHEANPASGGTVTEIELGDFLRPDHAGAEHQALFRLIGSLID